MAKAWKAETINRVYMLASIIDKMNEENIKTTVKGITEYIGVRDGFKSKNNKALIAELLKLGMKHNIFFRAGTRMHQVYRTNADKSKWHPIPRYGISCGGRRVFKASEIPHDLVGLELCGLQKPSKYLIELLNNKPVYGVPKTRIKHH